MKGMTKVRSELSTKLVLLRGDVDLNNDKITRLQEEIVETQGQIEAVEKVLELIGSAWTPPKKATKKFIKKKVTGLHPCGLDFALKMDATSNPSLTEIVAVLEETCTDEGASLSFQELFQAINARRRSKIKDHRLSVKLNTLRNSPHNELSTVVQRLGRGKASRYRLNRRTADHFKKISKAFA